MGQSEAQDARSSTAGTRSAATILFPITVSGSTYMGSHGREWTWKADLHPDPTGTGGFRLSLPHRA
jgi:hypothetical protein